MKKIEAYRPMTTEEIMNGHAGKYCFIAIGHKIEINECFFIVKKIKKKTIVLELLNKAIIRKC